jgi:hypothetical protein
VEELNIAITHLELRKQELERMLMKPTDFGRSPPTEDLLAMAEISTELAKVVFALDEMIDLKKAIENNAEANGSTED